MLHYRCRTASTGKNITGNYNTGVGFLACTDNTTGSANTSLGSYSLLHNTIGSYNTAIGFFSNQTNTTGNNNTSLAYNSNAGTTTSNNTTAIGSNANCNNYTDSTAIGYNATNTANNQVMLGTSSETVVIPGNASITGTINSISNDIFSKIQYLSTVSSNVQTQISNVASNKTFKSGLRYCIYWFHKQYFKYRVIFPMFLQIYNLN